jgi:hypothetical protein
MIALDPMDVAVALTRTQLKLQRDKPAEERYAGAPVRFIRARLGEFAWSKQVEILEAVVGHRRVAVQSCHGIGKSWTAAQLVAWWLGDHEPGEAFVVTTARTGAQVKAILWREIGRAHAKGRLPGRVNQTEWWMDVGEAGWEHEELVAFGRKPSDYDPDAFQGVHARYVLIIIDEASGVPKALFDAAQSLMTNEACRILAIGNPDDPSSHFCMKVLKPDSGWHLIRVDAFESPNFTDEEVPDELRELLVGKLYVEEARRDWGEGSPLWQSKVRGMVPEDTSDGVIPLSWLRRCQEEREWEEGRLLPVELGVDVGAGGDWTVVRERRGAKVGRTWRARTPEPQEATALIMGAIRETAATAVKVDAIGIGWGIVGMLHEALASNGGRAAPVIHAVNVGQSAPNPERFPKLRDQMWWELGRELSQDGGWDLSGLDDTTLAQLIAPRYKPDASGRVKIEPKDDTKKRLGRSPDDADALLLAYFVPPPAPFEGTVVYDEPVAISPV